MARTELNIASREIKQSYFDPKSKSYVTKSITVPAIVALGGTSTNTEINKKVVAENEKRKDSDQISINHSERVENKKTIILLGPIFTDWKYFGVTFGRLIQLGLLIVFVLLVIPMFRKKKFGKEIAEEVVELNRLLKRDGFNYSVLHKLVFYVEGSEVYTSPEQVIMSINISKEAKSYFVELIKKCETSEYGIIRNKTGENFRYKSKFYNELIAHTRAN
jgi:hypothetical protein